MFEIVRSKQESDITSNFVALGNVLDENNYSFHAGLVIQYESKLFEFHYTGEEIEFGEIQNDYYHKITQLIYPDEVPSFIAQCLNIQKRANPKYGYFYSGESYDDNGVHKSNKDLGERMTCVGFCLNVLKSFLEDDYLEYTDWNSDSDSYTKYLERFCEKYNLDLEKIKPLMRRITPRELLISGFFNVLPIKKLDIDNMKPEIENHFESRLASGK